MNFKTWMILFSLIFTITACQEKVSLPPESTDTSLSALTRTLTSTGYTPTVLNQDTESAVTLLYSEKEKIRVTSCAVFDLTNLSIIKACACVSGVCTVRVKGNPGYYGDASFNFTLSSKSVASEPSLASFTITKTPGPANTAPVTTAISPAAFNQDTQGLIALPYTDAENDLASSCAVSSLSNVTVTKACACVSGACSVGVTGLSKYYGAASFNFTVTANGMTSNSSKASLTINSSGGSNPNALSFTLTSSATTSAGIFDSTGVLIRTLWSNVKYNAGTHTFSWDKKNDSGATVSGTGYVAKVISNNVNYSWDGVVGNTSTDKTGPNKHRYIRRPKAGAIVGNTLYFAVGFNESDSTYRKMNLTDPQKSDVVIPTEHGDASAEANHVATDGIRVYWAGFDPWKADGDSFTFATNVSDDKDYPFNYGVSYSSEIGRVYPDVIDKMTGSNAIPSGIAVQKNGQYLFVAHKGLNSISVLNKISGAAVRSISFTSPKEMTVDGSDHLWIISGTNTVQKFSVNSNGTLSTPLLSLSGLVDPLAIAVSPSGVVAIADGGTSQQVKAFNSSTGASVWTLGQANGYMYNSTVANDKFYFNDPVTILEKPFIVFHADGSFWLGDSGNERMLHFSSTRSLIETVMSLPMTYSTTADVNNPSRVFSNYLEFEIDYSKPFGPNNGSWRLARNWRYGIRPTHYIRDPGGEHSIFYNAITLSNGRTYATLHQEVLELVNDGSLRYTGVKVSNPFKIDPDGTYRRIIGSNRIDEQPLTGFTSSGNPIWGSVKSVTIPSDSDGPQNGPWPSYPVKTSNGVYVLFDRDKDPRTINHLGGFINGKYTFKTSKATGSSYTGEFPTDGRYDSGNRCEYCGGNLYGQDKHLFWNYIGEFWKNGQVNKWNHYYENGLMIGQFGITTPDAVKLDGRDAPRMAAGNAFSAALVKVGSDYYIYHNDESAHGGAHRWKVSGLESIKEHIMTITD